MSSSTVEPALESRENVVAKQQQQQQPQRQLPEFASDPAAHVSFLLQKHNTTPIITENQHHSQAAGIFPVVRDPFSSATFFLLGRNHRGNWCHFNGYIDPGETVQQAAAREAYEESKAVLGHVCDLWRAVMCENIFSAPLTDARSGNMQLVYLGEMSIADRANFCAKFARAEAWSHCSNEVNAVQFFESRMLRHACLNSVTTTTTKSPSVSNKKNNGGGGGGGDDDDDDGDNASSQEKSSRRGGNNLVVHHVVVHVDPHTGVKEELRAGLAKAICRASFWVAPIMQEVCDLATVPLLPISSLPRLDMATAKKLPYRRPKREKLL